MWLVKTSLILELQKLSSNNRTMATGSLKIKLRPLRLAFLVRPSDKAAIATAIETTSFLWGGAYNPIIPVYHKLPRFWGRDSRRGITARSVLDGYLDAFDPDYVVKVGELESEDLKFGHREVVKCSEIIAPVEKDGTPKFGIGMGELLHHFYEKELKYVQVRPLIMCLPQIGLKHRLFLTSIFGAFPAKLEKQFQGGWAKDFPGLKYKECSLKNYVDFLSPDNLFIRRLGTWQIQPLRLRSFGHRNCIFFLNAKSNLDIIDYWNLRALGWNVMPVCQQMASDANLLNNATEYVEENSFPDSNNPNFFNDTTLLKSRTVSINELDKFGRSLKLTPSKHPHENKIVLNLAYPRIWDEWAREKDDAEPCDLQVLEEEHDISSEDKNITFRNLMPEFASRFGGHSNPISPAPVRRRGRRFPPRSRCRRSCGILR